MTGCNFINSPRCTNLMIYILFYHWSVIIPKWDISVFGSFMKWHPKFNSCFAALISVCWYHDKAEVWEKNPWYNKQAENLETVISTNLQTDYHEHNQRSTNFSKHSLENVRGIDCTTNLLHLMHQWSTSKCLVPVKSTRVASVRSMMCLIACCHHMAFFRA